MAKIMAQIAHGIYGYLDKMADQIIIDTAESSFLSRHASIYGVTRTEATVSTGNCTFTGTNGTLLPASTQIQVGDYTYTTDADGTVAAGSVTVAVTSEDTGAETQADAGQTASLTSPVAGIDTDGVVASGGLSGGSDRETDEALRTRLLETIQEPPKGGGTGDYVAWAKEVAGVTRAWEFGHGDGTGTVTVTFVRDNDVTIIPDSGEVDDVQTYIDSVAPIDAVVTVFAPTEVQLSPSITASLETGAVQATVEAAIEAELTDLLERKAEPGGTLRLSWIKEAISTATGEDYHTLTSPVADVTYDDDEVGTLGTVSFTWV
jgi:uncharacterized phage protein gp47/JayE